MRTSRAYTLISVAAAMIFLLLAGATLYFQVQDVKKERLGCERLDDLRFEVYDILASAVVTNRQRAAVAQTAEERRVNLDIAQDFKQRAIRLRHRVVAHAPAGAVEIGEKNHAGLPREIHVDCGEAYPYPLGL